MVEGWKGEGGWEARGWLINEGGCTHWLNLRLELRRRLINSRFIRVLLCIPEYICIALGSSSAVEVFDFEFVVRENRNGDVDFGEVSPGAKATLTAGPSRPPKRPLSPAQKVEWRDNEKAGLACQYKKQLES